VPGEDKMKLTRRQLSRLIKEEIALLSEGMYANRQQVEDMLEKEKLSLDDIKHILVHFFYEMK
jgi:3-oxoacyl-[acyl-carrier-protein] synthase III